MKNKHRIGRLPKRTDLGTIDTMMLKQCISRLGTTESLFQPFSWYDYYFIPLFLNYDFSCDQMGAS